MLKVMYKKVGKLAEIMEIEDELEVYNKLVGGYIETFRLTDEITIILNDEGKMQNLPINFELPCHGGFVETIVGDVVFVSTAPYDGDFHSLEQEHIDFIKKIGL